MSDDDEGVPVRHGAGYVGSDPGRGVAPVVDVRDQQPPDVSVVMPCLDEAASIGPCVRNAWVGIRDSGLRGEVIVADNGSVDDSVAIARAHGAIVVLQPERGYGNAYLAGFAAARGGIVVMGDSDESYDFTALPSLIGPLLEGSADYVLGSRFGGTIEPGAMSWSHRYIGNPVLTLLLNRLFGLRVSDAHSGLRAFTRTALDSMELRTEGMEFASEIVVKAASVGLRVAEIPIVYHPRVGESKLKSLRDAWRHIRFLLTLSPNHLLVYPGMTLAVGGLATEIGLTAAGAGSLALGAKALVALVCVLGAALASCGAFAGAYSSHTGFDRSGRLLGWVQRSYSFERGLVFGGLLGVCGTLLIGRQLAVDHGSGVGGVTTASMTILGLTMLVLAAQVVCATLVLNILVVLRTTPTRRSGTGAGVVSHEPVPVPLEEVLSAAVGEAS